MIYYKTLNLSKDGKCGISLTSDYTKVEYPLDGTPVEVPGKGAFIAPINGGIFAGGVGKIICKVKTLAPVEKYAGEGIFTCKKISLQQIDLIEVAEKLEDEYGIRIVILDSNLPKKVKIRLAEKLKDEGSIYNVILYSNLPKKVKIRLAEKLKEELNIYFVIHLGNLPEEVKKSLEKKIQ